MQPSSGVYWFDQPHHPLAGSLLTAANPDYSDYYPPSYNTSSHHKKHNKITNNNNNNNNKPIIQKRVIILNNKVYPIASSASVSHLHQKGGNPKSLQRRASYSELKGMNNHHHHSHKHQMQQQQMHQIGNQHLSHKKNIVQEGELSPKFPTPSLNRVPNAPRRYQKINDENSPPVNLQKLTPQPRSLKMDQDQSSKKAQVPSQQIVYAKNKQPQQIIFMEQTNRTQKAKQPEPCSLFELDLTSNNNKTSHKQKEEIKLCKYYMQSLKEALHKPYSIDYFQALFRDHFIQNYQSVRKIPELLSTMQPGIKPAIQPKNASKRKTLVLDLDETLVHCCDPHQPCDATLILQMPTGQQIESRLCVRPFARQTLEKLQSKFEIVVFTAGHSIYANKVIDQLLDPERKYISQRLFRENCSKTEQGCYVKDLSILGRPMESVILVDNAVYSFAMQLSNGVPILPFYHNKEDHQLPVLADFLMSLCNVDDVRTHLQSNFQLSAYNESSPQLVFERLFQK